MSLKEQWRLKAEASLLDPPKEEYLEHAMKEAKEVAKGKEVPTFALLDVALVRLKLLLKVQLNGEDELLYKQALSVIKEAPSEGSERKSNYASKTRRSEFDL
ncbi:hypothetical protein BBW65_05530 [Helicobacter enhydrae]|uniref:Uncharacterized protein n=1 Tax=Helicobacter enhydrae TaxID=222136 RepID=A0A1B1U6D5_9HELI|nr:hypothetical protein [Helicobacter enhydrae]ANV98291.1 hypothetical protein BBW65_05530 [Helicobacter enhydrae]